MTARVASAGLLVVLVVTARCLVSPLELSLHCGEGEFGCGDGSRCIPSSRLCDSSIDCLDGSDEPSTCTVLTCSEGKCEEEGKEEMVEDAMGGVTEEVDCLSGEVTCADGSCLPISQHCNGQIDCKDKSDEGPFCEEKSCQQLSCSHLCRQTRLGPHCACPPGIINVMMSGTSL